MKAVYSHGCGQIATVRAIEFTFGEQATGSSWREGQCCIIVAGVIIVIVVIVAGVHRRCHRHRCHCRWCASPVSSSSLSLSPVCIAAVIVIIHGTKASLKQKDRPRGCHRPPVNMDYGTKANFGKGCEASRTTVSYCTNNHGTQANLRYIAVNDHMALRPIWAKYW